MHTKKQAAVNDSNVVSKALMNAADHLKITNAELAKIVDVSETKLSKIDRQNAFLNPEKKEFELALLFIRLFRSLDSIMAGDNSSSADWMRNNNSAIGDIPLNHVKTITGLVNVISYLDSRRARI